jgi:hypothetical protein
MKKLPFFLVLIAIVFTISGCKRKSVEESLSTTAATAQVLKLIADDFDKPIGLASPYFDEIAQKLLAREVQLFWTLEDTNKTAFNELQAKYGGKLQSLELENGKLNAKMQLGMLISGSNLLSKIQDSKYDQLIVQSISKLLHPGSFWIIIMEGKKDAAIKQLPYLQDLTQPHFKYFTVDSTALPKTILLKLQS